MCQVCCVRNPLDEVPFDWRPKRTGKSRLMNIWEDISERGNDKYKASVVGTFMGF